MSQGSSSCLKQLLTVVAATSEQNEAFLQSRSLLLPSAAVLIIFTGRGRRFSAIEAVQEAEKTHIQVFSRKLPRNTRLLNHFFLPTDSCSLPTQISACSAYFLVVFFTNNYFHTYIYIYRGEQE